jgi:AraC-like DNA-binding protein
MEPLTAIQGECRVYSDRSDTHDHPFAQLILPLHGILAIETSRHQVELDETQLFFLPPQCQHTFHAKQSNQFLVLDIPPILLRPDKHDALHGGLLSNLDERWQGLRSLLLHAVNSNSDDSELTYLFHYAYHLLKKNCTPRSLQYIHANYHQVISLKTLAMLEGYNLTYYGEWFKQLTGKTPKTYIQTIRLEKAKELLTSSNASIMDIAQQVGYEHHSSLTRLFQQVEGITPALYRQQIRTLVKK